jgi:hypothetical protein
MNTRPGMSCTDCGVDDDCMHAIAANDDTLSPWSARGLMGDRLWALYCERWQPMRWVPQCLRRRRRMA